MSHQSSYSQMPRSGPGDAHISVTQRMIRAFMERRRAKRYPPPKMSAMEMFTAERCFTVSAPCMNGGFSFEVSVVAVWSGREVPEFADWAIERAELTHREDVEKQIRLLARGFEPDALAVAEACINEKLKVPLRYEMGLLTCRSWVRVGPDDALRRHLQKLWTNQSDDDAQQERAKRHIVHVSELRDLWEEFLQQVNGPTVAPAVRLANNSRLVGDVVSEVAKAKQATMQELCRIVDRAAGDYEKSDLYEYAFSYDSALQKLIQYLDISAGSDNGTGRGVA